MRPCLLYASILATLLAFLATPALGQANFRTMVTFGDSLTHNDLLFLVDGRPRALYGKDAMEAVFRKGAGPGDDLISYAIAGLESDDLQTEIFAYELALLFGFHREATVIGFEIGSNDVLRKVDLLAAHPPGENALADRVIDSLISNMRRDFEYLVLRHPNATFILWTIPDITLTPRLINDLSDRQRQNVREHLERVNGHIRSANQFRRIVVLDLYRLLKENVANPPSVLGHPIMPPPAHGDFDNLFADDIHPTAVANAFVANEMILWINDKWDDHIPFYTEEELAKLACPADLDGDGTVGFGDLGMLLAEWGPCPPDCFTDVDGDGFVGFFDLVLLIDEWGPC